jgi:nucleotide-binding universal stress UspA family protein
MQRILVGVDASPASVDALRRAAEEAALREATLEVVTVVAPPDQVTAFPVPPGMGRDQPTDTEALRAQATEGLGAWLDEVDVDLEDLEVEYVAVVDRRPSRAIVERSRHADLVVVGSRGRGGFTGLKLGSVSEQVTRHAKAPVLVIRESTDD